MYYALEPFGEYQEYWRTGLICSMIANIMRGKNQRAYVPEDFMPQSFVMKRKQSTSELKELFQAHFDKGDRKITKKDFMRARRKRGIKKGKR